MNKELIEAIECITNALEDVSDKQTVRFWLSYAIKHIVRSTESEK